MSGGSGVRPETLSVEIAGRLEPAGRQWLDRAARTVAESAPAIRPLFPAAGRYCGRGPLDAADPALAGWTVDDAARALLLAALPLSGVELAIEVVELYRYGDAAEKRGVLRGLAVLDRPDRPDRTGGIGGLAGLGGVAGLGDGGLPVVRDALRTNDTRLVSAALGPYAAAHLDQPAYRQGVLKCVFMGIALDEISGLEHRVDGELIRMMRDYAAERRAAGRIVPADVWRIAPEED